MLAIQQTRGNTEEWIPQNYQINVPKGGTNKSMRKSEPRVQY